jgi:alanine racemase
VPYSRPQSATSRADRSYAAIDLGALASNFAHLRERARGRDVIAVVKADAYGHGAVPVVRRLRTAGCRRFAVAVLSEAAALRRAGIDASLLLLGGVGDAAEAGTALALGLEPVVHRAAQADWIEAAAQRLGVCAAVHVEVDTGMRRLGVPVERAPALLARVASSARLRLAGIATHFACAEQSDPSPSRVQLERFRAVLAAARAAGVEPDGVHVSNSAALLAGTADEDDRRVGDAVRPGLALYGAVPAAALADPALRPVMSLRTEIVAVREIAAGEGVGYGHTWHAPSAGFVATLPLGYADGIPWSGARSGCVAIGGVRRPLAGRVSMDSMTVWLDREPLPVGAEAIVFGAGDAVAMRVEEWAQAAGTIPYELLVRVGARVPRRLCE